MRVVPLLIRGLLIDCLLRISGLLRICGLLLIASLPICGAVAGSCCRRLILPV